MAPGVIGAVVHVQQRESHEEREEMVAWADVCARRGSSTLHAMQISALERTVQHEQLQELMELLEPELYVSSELAEVSQREGKNYATQGQKRHRG